MMEYATPLLFTLTLCLVFVLGIIFGRLTMVWTMREYADITSVPTDISDAMRVKTISNDLVVMHVNSFGNAAQSYSRTKQDMFEYRAQRDELNEEIEILNSRIEDMKFEKEQLSRAKKQKGGGKKE